MASNAFHRWVVHCMSAAGLKDLMPLDVLVLHHVSHRARDKRLSDICFIMNIEDTHLVNYSLISALWGETRCADDTMCEPVALAAGVVVALGVLAMCSPSMARSLDFLLTICQRFVDDKGKHPSQSASPAPTVLSLIHI